MAYPLNQNVKKPYSLAFVDGYLQIENGLEGKYNFLGSTVALVKDCNAVNACNSELKRFIPDNLKIWGKKVDCCEYQLDSVSLDPKNFGYENSEELLQAINGLLSPQAPSPSLDFVDGNGSSIGTTTPSAWEKVALSGAPANKVLQVYITSLAPFASPVGVRKVGATVEPLYQIEQNENQFRLVKSDENGEIEIYATASAPTFVFQYAGYLDV